MIEKSSGTQISNACVFMSEKRLLWKMLVFGGLLATYSMSAERSPATQARLRNRGNSGHPRASG